MDIDKIIKSKVMTNASFAEAIGVTENTVYCWRGGRQNVGRLTKMIINIWLEGGDCKATFTEKQWSKYRKKYTVKELCEMTDLDEGTIRRINGELEFSKRIQAILKYKLGK